MMLHHLFPLALSSLLISTVHAGTFQLYDITGGQVLTSIVNRGKYDLNDWGLGANPQVALLYDSDTPETESVFLSVSARDAEGTRETLSEECDSDAPYSALSLGDGSPAPFAFPLGERVRVLARIGRRDNCRQTIERERIKFTVLNSFSGTPAPTTPMPTDMPTTPMPTDEPTTAAPTTASPSTASPTSATPTTASPSTAAPTTASPTTATPTTASPSTAAPTTASPTTASPTTATPTTASPTTATPTTASPSTATPTTATPTTATPTTAAPTTAAPTTATPTTAAPVAPGPARLCPEDTTGIDPTSYGVCLDLLDMEPADVAVFLDARTVWTDVVTGDVPDRSFASLATPTDLGMNPLCTYSAVGVDDLYICADFPAIDGEFNVLGFAGPRLLRGGSGLPIVGVMSFDIADVARLRNQGTLEAVIVHEMGHVFGIGTVWQNLGITGTDAQDCPYFGTHANTAWEILSGCSVVPTELDGLSGTRCGHWDECMDGEIMTGFLDSTNFFSNVTIAGLDDIGYEVDYGQAEPFPANFNFGACACPDPSRNLRGLQEQPEPFTPKKLNAVAISTAEAYGKKLLAEAKAARANLTPEQQEQFIGDKFISIIMEDDEGTIGFVGVWGDEE